MDFTFDCAEIGAAIHDLAHPDLTKVGEGLHAVLTDVTNTWEGAAYGLQLPGMTRAVHDPVYAQSIDFRQDGLLRGSVASSDAARDARAQDYQAPWDMKPGLLHGPKSRETKAKRGDPVHRFNIIPMRHQAETVSQEALWALLSNVQNFQPRDVPRQAKFTPVGVYVHQAALEAGIRMGRAGPVTFRTVSTRSPAASWWYPARAANPITDAVWALLEDAVIDELLAAWEAAFGL